MVIVLIGNLMTGASKMVDIVGSKAIVRITEAVTMKVERVIERVFIAARIANPALKTVAEIRVSIETGII